MPRRNNTRRPDEPRPLGGGLSHQRVESGADGDWHVRAVPGAQATKVYRCPGCDHEIAVGVAHVVAWAADGGIEDRRHWHRGCWSARTRRGPTPKRW
ncbi:hypothetical protein [Actinokineospora pegani]|uniref:hypothetical protein n=1 Tax=Actinokineospora pegani TaxID=2654637 RepID=UPI0018D37E27